MTDPQIERPFWLSSTFWLVIILFGLSTALQILGKLDDLIINFFTAVAAFALGSKSGLMAGRK